MCVFFFGFVSRRHVYEILHKHSQGPNDDVRPDVSFLVQAIIAPGRTSNAHRHTGGGGKKEGGGEKNK